MQTLNYPAPDLKLRSEGPRYFVYDNLRQKWLVLTPEEWVRQHVLHYLVSELGYPTGLLTTETGLQYNGMQRRSDIVCYSNMGTPILLIECKAYNIKIGQDTFNQAAQYNSTLKAPYLMITNGMLNFCCHINFETGTTNFLNRIPAYSELSQQGL